MNWKTKFAILLLIAVPAFTGYPLTTVKAEMIPGISYGWGGYFIIVNSLILILTGKHFYADILALAALISLPVVYVGAAVSFLLFIFGVGHPAGPASYSAHYVSLSLTMLTVIPLALTLVALIPFHNFEQQLLTHATGVSKPEKFALMFLRVFNHIVYFVIPNIVETMREEAQFKRRLKTSSISASGSVRADRLQLFMKKVKGLIRDMIQLGVEGICASIQFIPLWAVEISRLPDRRSRKLGRATEK